MWIKTVNHAECGIAIPHAFSHDTKCEQVMDLVKCEVLVLHLSVNRHQVLDATADFTFYPSLSEGLLKFSLE